MAYTLRATSDSVQLAGPVRNFFSNIEDALARRALYRRTVSELQSLTNRELADLGISRSGIRGLARETVYSA